MKYFYQTDFDSHFKTVSLTNKRGEYQVLLILLKSTLTLICMVGLCWFNSHVQAQVALHEENTVPIISGRVCCLQTREPLDGVTLKIGHLSTKTSKDGKFLLKGPFFSDTLFISHVGYRDTIIRSVSPSREHEILLVPLGNRIEEVEIVNTGYQKIPRERATGSFSTIDREMLERRVSTNLVEKLDGMAAGLVTNLKGRERGQADIEIRGKSTLYSNAEPLIVLDEFPYEGDLKSINPNDIENITILKDAAAASIWGVRASNGVIVITTKKAEKGSRPLIEFGTNQSFSGERNVFDRPMLSSSEYIEIEKFLFDQGKYNAALNRGYSSVSPVVEILSQLRSGKFTQQQSDAEIGRLSQIDATEEFNRYFNQGRHEQQYSVSARGAGEQHDYFISAGLDKNRTHSIGSSFERWSLQAANSFKFLNNTITLSHRVLYSNNADVSDRVNLPTEPKYPYSQYMDGEGNYLPEVSALRLSYISALEEDRLLDWHYRPLENLYNSDFHSQRRTTNFRNSLELEAILWKDLKVSMSYLFEEGGMDNPTYYGPNSYYTRNLINKFSYLTSDQELGYHLPFGGILAMDNRKVRNQTGRFQFGYGGSFEDIHQLHVIVGAEVREHSMTKSAYGLYGYNEENQTHQNHLIDYSTPFPVWYSGETERINTRTSRSSALDRFVSYYSNFLYSLHDRYRLSFSLRRDGSNLFGVDANQKFVPLWSLGGQWDLHREDFFPKDHVSRFQLRFSYGYNGNINRSVSGYLTARASNSVGTFLQPIYEVLNPPNPSLRWERVKNVNAGLEIGLFENRVSLNTEYWRKYGLDLIADKPTATQTGISGFTGNSSSTLSKGIDISLNSVNLRGRMSWNTQFFVGLSKNKVTEFFGIPASNYNIMSQIHDYPMIGYPQFALFTFPMKGLNKQGDPVGYLEGAESTDYRAIKNSQHLTEMEFVGSSVPTANATLWNRLQFGQIEFSFSIRWAGGYYFRRKSLDNGELYDNYNYVWDYQERWQKVGDENHTTVPGLVYPSNVNRNHFYKYSSVLVENGSHIVLQDIQLILHADKLLSKFSVFRGKLILSATDLGTIWTRNDRGIDPRYSEGLRIRPTFSLGIHINL